MNEQQFSEKSIAYSCKGERQPEGRAAGGTENIWNSLPEETGIRYADSKAPQADSTWFSVPPAALPSGWIFTKILVAIESN